MRGLSVVGKLIDLKHQRFAVGEILLMQHINLWSTEAV